MGHWRGKAGVIEKMWKQSVSDLMMFKAAH
jgi:hypothetical protein